MSWTHPLVLDALVDVGVPDFRLLELFQFVLECVIVVGEGGVHIELLPIFEPELVRQALDFLVDELQQLLLFLLLRLGALVLGAQGDGTYEEEGRRQDP